MRKSLVIARRSVVAVALAAVLAGCGMVEGLLFPPVNGVWVDDEAVLVACGSEVPAVVTVVARPHEEKITRFTVTPVVDSKQVVVPPFLGEGSSGFDDQGRARVSISGDTASGEVSFTYVCGEAEDGTVVSEYVTLLFSASKRVSG